MMRYFNSIFRFLPIQLFLLHFRKYQILLLFWVILFGAVTNNIASKFGAQSLFLSPEYLGEINMQSFALLGITFGIFSMSWHITTFIIHSKRLPFLGAIKNAFIRYCHNNGILPWIFLFIYACYAFQQLRIAENKSLSETFGLLLAFFLGYIFSLLVSFGYFFKVDKNILKELLSIVANPNMIRQVIPYDSLDSEADYIYANTCLTSKLKIEAIPKDSEYNLRFLNKVLRRHHRNAIFAFLFAIVILIILSVINDNYYLMIPAGASFLILFSIILMLVGAFKYFLKSWELIGWIGFIGICSLLTYNNMLDLRTAAFGMDYNNNKIVNYNYETIEKIHSIQAYHQDLENEVQRLDTWKNINQSRTAIIIAASGGGSRAAYWTLSTLQYLDSISKGGLFDATLMITGASGGLIGASYWQNIHTANRKGLLSSAHDPQYLQNIGKDLLNPIVYSMATGDFFIPFNKVQIGDFQYTKNRAYALQQALEKNTNDILSGSLQDLRNDIDSGHAPLLIIPGTIMNDGRKIFMSPNSISFLSRDPQSLHDSMPVIDAIDFQRMFVLNKPNDLKLTAALTINATFPIILPVTKFPTNPTMEVIDAGLRDNFGIETSSRYILTLQKWLEANVESVIIIQIRDTRDYMPSQINNNESFLHMLIGPAAVIQNKWSSFQTNQQTYITSQLVANSKIDILHETIYYEDEKVTVPLSFHLTQREKNSIRNAIMLPNNQKVLNKINNYIKKN